MRFLFIYTVSCFIFISSVNSQVKSGKIIYGITKNLKDEASKTKNVGYEDFKSKIYKVISDLEFVLEFNRNQSIFQLNKALAIDQNELYAKSAIFIARGDRVFYTNIDKNLLLVQRAFMNEELLIKSSMDDLGWKLTKESKMIDDYQCYKAIASKEIRDKENKKKKYSYEVWYCPSITFQFGPFDFNNLPGLILEFSNNEFIYTAKKISLYNDDMAIKAPKKGRAITKKDFELMTIKSFENHRD